MIRNGRYKNRIALFAAAVMLLVLPAAFSTYAFLQHNTEGVVNSFTAAAAPEVTIEESFDGQVKSNVCISLGNDETDDYGSYFVRAAITVSFRDESGNTLAVLPSEGSDYTMVMGSDWSLNDGFWYYNGALKPGESTTNLIESCSTANPDLHLAVDIAAQIIQALPADAAESAWGFVPAGSN